jgi:hypothetical protein
MQVAEWITARPGTRVDVLGYTKSMRFPRPHPFAMHCPYTRVFIHVPSKSAPGIAD